MGRLDMTSYAPDPWAVERLRMVEDQIVFRGVTDPVVLDAMRTVPRHLFVPEGDRGRAYDDGPLAIGRGQTISQPYIVALMTELAQPTPASRVLEIGTGCGYQTAVLAACAGEVWTVEIEPELSERAARTLAVLGVSNVHRRIGDGSLGWPEEAPFDAIVVTAAPAEVPPALIEQLGEGSRLVIPLGTSSQELFVFTREGGEVRRERSIGVRFVPLR
jgi:protein-L-isoaspartate(D-aspartate) O-methyltransferase